MATPNISFQRTTRLRLAAEAGSFGGVLSRLIGVTAVFLTVVAGTGCDGGIYVRGIVQTPDATPIGGATIVLASPKGLTFNGKSNASGCFSLGGTTAPGRYRYSLIATAPNRKTVTTAILTLRKNFVSITLSPEGGHAESAALSVETVTSESPCSAD